MMNEPTPTAPKIEDFRDYLMVLARARLHSSRQRQLDASDIVQETLLEAHRKADQFRGTEAASMAAWLRQMLAFNLTDRLRALGRQKRDASREVSWDAPYLEESSTRLENWVSTQQSSPSRKMMRLESVLEVASAMEQLSEGQRDALRMRYIEVLPLTEIAARMERSETAVAGLLKRGLECLREKLDRT